MKELKLDDLLTDEDKIIEKIIEDFIEEHDREPTDNEVDEIFDSMGE